MSRFLAEPAFVHDHDSRLGVLLLNLGTPDAPTPSAVRRYLAEFLSDPRVVEIPRAAWLPILHGVILRVRPARSAQRYAAIWTKDGSPLLVHSQRQRSLLLGYLGQRLKALGLPSDHMQVELGMRYGEPSIAGALERLRAGGCDRVLVLPLYPQYAASTTASGLDAVFAATRRMRRVPALRVVDAYHDDAGYIGAVVRNINDYWVKNGRPNKLVLSFHGVPRRTLDRGDPYHCHCQKTGRLIATELGLKPEQYALTFQSRFGRAEWLKPYTQATLAALAKDRRAPGRRRLPRFRGRLPGNARGDRPRGKSCVPRSRGQGISRHPVPERTPGMDRRAGRPRAEEPRRLARPAPQRGGAGAGASASDGAGRAGLSRSGT